MPPRRGRPEHSLLSITLLALIAATVLYGVAWSVADPAKPVYSWDFTKLKYDESEWEFPYVLREQTDPGVTCVTPGTRPGPALIMDLDTDTFRTIRATIIATHAEDETPVPCSLEWYWATAEDVAAAGEDGWAFSTEQGVAFTVPNRHEPNTYVARVNKHKKWDGIMVRAFIGVKFPPSETGPFKFRTLHIEFLE